MVCCFVVIILISGVYGCEMDRYNSNTVLYFNGEILNLTVREGAYPDDIEVTKITGSCSSPMHLLPDQYFDDTFKTYDHLKQIRVPMTSAMHGCAYDVTMRARSACLVRRVARFAMRAGRAAVPAAPACQVALALRWRAQLRAKLAAESFVCDAALALCDQRDYVVRRDIVLNSDQIIPNTDSDNPRKIQINLREEDFAQNVSTFVCQAASQYLPGNFTVAGRLVSAGAARASDVWYRAGDEYNTTCAGPHAYWISGTDVQRSAESESYTRKLRKEDDGMKLICVNINCEAFESNQTCYKKILTEVRFRLKAAPKYGVMVCAVGAVGAVGASLALAGALACAARARGRRTPAVARRPRMPTPPPERPPRRQPYYSVPFERPIPGPHCD